MGSINKCYLLAKGLDAPILLRPLFLAINCINNARINRLVVVISW